MSCGVLAASLAGLAAPSSEAEGPNSDEEAPTGAVPPPRSWLGSLQEMDEHAAAIMKMLRARASMPRLGGGGLEARGAQDGPPLLTEAGGAENHPL